MKWFKHDSDASMDAKLMAVRMKYGMEGYGLYWYLLELIATGVDKNNLTFELEHDAQIVSFHTGIHVDRINEMMLFMVERQLFELSANKLTCIKMALRTDEYTAKLINSMKKNPDSIPTLSRQHPDIVPTASGQNPEKSVLLEEKRREENIHPKPLKGQNVSPKKANGKTRFQKPTVEEIRAYVEEKGYGVDPQEFFDYYESCGWIIGKSRKPMSKWRNSLGMWEAKRKKEEPSNPTYPEQW